MRFSIRYADRIVGLFILVAVVFLVVLLFFLGANQRWFAQNYVYTSRFPSANNLSVGTGIFFKGFEIGKISKVVLNPDDEVDVEFYVYDTYADRVRENSILELSVSPIGLGTSLLFHKGKGDKVLPETAFVPSFDTPEGKELVESGLVDLPKKDDTITRLLSNVNQVMEGLNRTMLSLNLAIEGKGGGEIQQILLGVKTAVASLDKVLKDAQGAVGGIYTSFGGVMDNVNGLLGNANGVVGGLGQSIPELMGNLDGVMKQVDGIMKQLDATMGNFNQMSQSFADPSGLVPKIMGPGSLTTMISGPELWNGINGILANLSTMTVDLQKMMVSISGEVPKLSGLLLDAGRVLEQTQDVMEGLRNNPLLKGGIPQKPVQESTMNSLRGEEF